MEPSAARLKCALASPRSGAEPAFASQRRSPAPGRATARCQCGLADPVVAGQIASEPEDPIQARTGETQRLHEFVFFIASIYRPPDLRQLDEAPHNTGLLRILCNSPAKGNLHFGGIP